ncbi:monocarboxylate transporter 14 isoform X2 [Ctenocephalides felis]|uniref:monocarboxylate transporter 14 isoform X2 n=1 Tax=Ctenocephalides felis TaxID=7515 RepID=UPI000E6E30A0|nr:monocarboxylate transporter 14 isoform X2 [Ctenocephalides felis]
MEKDMENNEDQKEIKMESGEESMRPVLNTPDPVATATVIVPPDGGWGWVIVAASFMSNMIVDGIVFCIGPIIEEIQISFGASKAKVALISSLLSGFYLMAGPFASGLANRYGFRGVSLVGALLAASGLMVSYFATSVEFLFVSYGVVGGLGFCFLYMPSVITVGYYFERWRALATGISLCGSGVGMFLFSPLITLCLSNFGWRTTMLIQACLVLCCILCAMSYRPLKPVLMCQTPKPERANASKLGSVNRVAADQSQAFSAPRSTWIGANNNMQYPTAADAVLGSQANLERRGSLASTTKSIGIDPKELRPVGEDEEVGSPLINGQASGAGSRRRTLSGRRASDSTKDGHRSRRGTITGTETSRPMYRDDVLYSGSLARLPQYQSTTSIGYHMSVTRLPTRADVEEQSSCKLCPEAFRRTLATMLDMNLMRSPSFLLLAFSGFFTMMGYLIPFLYIAQRNKTSGMTDDETAWLLSTIGISNTLTRVICGVLASNTSVNVLWINNITLTMGGVATLLSGLYYTAAYQYAYCCIFGISIACFASLRSILVVDLMGLEKLNNAFGILMLFQGVASSLGPPIAGIFMDATGSFDASFYLSGALFTVSAVLCYPLKMVKNWEESKATTNQLV